MNAQKGSQKQVNVAQDIIEEVEEFILHMNNRDYIIDSRGTTLKFTHNPLIENGRKESYLSDILSDSITAYELYRYNPEKRFEWACQCLVWINKAHTFGIIKEGEGLINKFNKISEKNIELLKENNILKKELEKINAELAEAKEKIKEYEDNLPHFTSDIT